MRFLFLLLVPALMAAAQDRDFLTADEADQIREAQEPNLRLSLYVKFAQTRVELLKQLLAKEKPGRSVLIHDTLEDYTRIIEAIDTVADDALKRKLDITEGMKTVAGAEKDMLAALEEMSENAPNDYSRYEFAMQQAIETTTDSAELSAEDLKDRAVEVAERARRERAEREALMPADEVKQKRAAEKKEEQRKRKVPTLRRKGEVPKTP
jgi:hypothetical protein